MRRLLTIVTVLLLTLLLGGMECGFEEDEPDLVFDFDLNTDLQGWVGGFTDYPVDLTDWPDFELTWGHEPLPSNLGSGSGLYISGKNYSDDLFMFIKRRVTGLGANTTYRLRFKIKVATNAPSECGGIGGPPGEAVYLKAGAVLVEPVPADSDGYYQLNIDKGNQAAGGADAIVLGHIGNSNTDCIHPVYEIKTLDSGSKEFELTTDSEGSAWIIVGTDSGFEGQTSLYYNQVKTSFSRNL